MNSFTWIAANGGEQQGWDSDWGMWWKHSGVTGKVSLEVWCLQRRSGPQLAQPEIIYVSLSVLSSPEFCFLFMDFGGITYFKALVLSLCLGHQLSFALLCPELSMVWSALHFLHQEMLSCVQSSDEKLCEWTSCFPKPWCWREAGSIL